MSPRMVRGGFPARPTGLVGFGLFHYAFFIRQGRREFSLLQQAVPEHSPLVQQGHRPVEGLTHGNGRLVQVRIGERRKPTPEGRPGFLRVDMVHQGDQDGVKGLYHIDAVDEVTQMQVVVSVERISERYLLPVLEALLKTFPFTILGFHTDNGSEYINRRVAELLKKLHIELTKTRPRKSNDNALVESKNASVVRKHMGYQHIPIHSRDCGLS